ncbi:MAG: PilZ domain-containing protein [Myxococcales bacterium]|nr:PilZ domain-containing protein [Myxococcales bacterium]
MSTRPTALLLDDGELDDVDVLLRELDTDRMRLSGDDRPDPWPWPASVLVTTPQRALSLEIPALGERDYVTIVVTEDDSSPLHTPQSPIDFDYLVRRPVHPEALRLLLLRALYDGNDQRAEPRLPVGTRVTWISGLRPGRATLLEISQRGCRMLAARPVARGSRVAVHLPRELAGGVGVVLRGRVVRARGLPAGETSDAAVLAVEFEAPGFLARDRIGALLRELEIGPPRLREDEMPAATPARTPVSSAGAPHAASTAATAVHRHQQRAAVRWEVVAVDERAERVIHVFVGRNLSTGGLRVEAHPSIALGDALRLAIYSATRSNPIIVDAQVVRDDGGFGFGLSFMDVDPAVTQELEAIVASASAEVLETADAKPRAVLVAEILSEALSVDEFSPASRIHAVKTPAGASPPQLDKLEAAVLDLARVGCTVQRVFDVIPESPIGIVRALESLLESERIRVER